MKHHPVGLYHVPWYTSELRVRLARHEASLSHPVKYFMTVSRRYFFVDHLCYLCLVFYIFAPLLIVVVMLLRQFIAALWSPAGKGLTSCLSVFMSNCEVVTFPLVSWIRSGALMDRFLIFALFLILFKLCPWSHITTAFRQMFRPYTHYWYLGWGQCKWIDSL